MDPSFGSNPVKSMDRCRETRLCSVNLVVNNYSRVFIQFFKTSVVVNKQYNRPLTNLVLNNNKMNICQFVISRIKQHVPECLVFVKQHVV